MKPTQLILRCYAENSDGAWRAMCLDLNLAAEADTFERVREKLELQIREYVADALVGQDRAFGERLLSRRAPLKYWVRYWRAKIRDKFDKPQHPGSISAFICPMPLQPCI
ncbi:MAG TPA: hypothetical protein VNR18_07560 [Hyphomicrobiales bacterium]|nr:hypothetical protein [Hyphomicrobiales bacterium]